MKKPDDNITDETELNNDLEVFEEWESGDKTDPSEAKAISDDSGGEALADDLDVLEDFPEALPDEEVVSPTPERQPEPAVEPEPAADVFADDIAGLAPDVPVAMVAVIGRTTTDVGRMIDYRIGEVIDLSRAPGETVDVVANGKLFARGELVEMDGKLGVRILKLVR